MCDAEKQSEHEEAVENLREILKPGDTVYTILRHVSRSGMTRYIDVYVFRDNEPRYISYWASKVLDWKMSRTQEGIKIGGCGMDMGFHLVYSLSHRLFPKGFGEPCHVCGYRPSTKEEANHYNDNFTEGVAPHEFYGRNGDRSGWDNNGGYALKQRWL